MRTVIIIVVGVALIVLAWFFFAYREINRYQDLVDAEQYRLEGQIPKLLGDVPGYLSIYGKYFPTAVDTSWAEELDMAANDCELVLKTVSATKGVSTDEVDRLNGCLTKLYAAYEGTRDQIHIDPGRSPSAWKDKDFVDRDRRMGIKFNELTTQIGYINNLMDWFRKGETRFPKSIVAGIFGFPKWHRFYDNGSQRYR
jgi:hypothetical protein